MALLRRFQRNTDGATIIEFAVVAPVLFLLIFLIIEMGLMMFTQIALESATMQVSRTSSIGGSSPGCDRACTVRNLIERKTRGLIHGDQVMIEARSLADGGLPPQPDICLSDPPSIQFCPTGHPFSEQNGIPGFQGSSELSSTSVGNAGDMVEIRVNYPWRTLIPFLGSLYGPDGVVLLSASTIVKNEP